jgi:hypothetical protein
MEPYIQFAMALMQDKEPTPELETIRALPVEKRLRLEDRIGT